jgi:GNAT superfamily N-acetyltransferase
VNCRVATLDDVPTLAAMRWAFRAEGNEVPIESEPVFTRRYDRFVRDALTSGHWTYWVAESDGGELVAHMAVLVVQSIPRPSRPRDQWGYLTDCYTRPEFRNQGVGQQLLARVRAWAEAQDLEMLLVWPSDRSESFYARAGFARGDEIRVLHLRDYDAAAPAGGIASNEAV